jgi:hypothetical protein
LVLNPPQLQGKNTSFWESRKECDNYISGSFPLRVSPKVSDCVYHLLSIQVTSEDCRVHYVAAVSVAVGLWYSIYRRYNAPTVLGLCFLSMWTRGSFIVPPGTFNCADDSRYGRLINSHPSNNYYYYYRHHHPHHHHHH